ncbi:MAG: hypothetical protein IPN34_14105 [Planctomycetes bacterium]|nr:hypothetical protein [Planctomycetota bacterium]
MRALSLAAGAALGFLLPSALLAQSGPPPTKQAPDEFSFNQLAGADTSKVFKKLFVAERSLSRINFAYEFQPGRFATSFEGQGSSSYGVLKGVRRLGTDWEITVGFRIGSFDGLVQNSTNFGLERDVWANDDPKRGELEDFFYAGLTYLNGDLRAFTNKNGQSVGSPVTLAGTTEGYLRMHQMGTMLEVHAWAPGGQPQLVFTENAPQPATSNYSFGAARMGAGTHILCLGADMNGDVNGDVETPAITEVTNRHTALNLLFVELCGQTPDLQRIRGDLTDLQLDLEALQAQLPNKKTPGVQLSTQGNTAKKHVKNAAGEIEEAVLLLALPDIEGAKALVTNALTDLELSKGALKGLSVKKREQAPAVRNNGF